MKNSPAVAADKVRRDVGEQTVRIDAEFFPTRTIGENEFSELARNLSNAGLLKPNQQGGMAPPRKRVIGMVSQPFF